MNGAIVTPQDELLLRKALELAKAGRASGNPPFGSLLAGPDGTILAEEYNTTLTESDITAHPELKLAKWAARELDPATAAGVTMYTSCEPCGMCENAINRSGLGRVVFALSGEQLIALKPPATPVVVPVEGPALTAEVVALFEGYYG